MTIPISSNLDYTWYYQTADFCYTEDHEMVKQGHFIKVSIQNEDKTLIK